MNPNYIVKALGFHGQPMQKIWEDEHGTESLQTNNVPADIDFSVYMQRQKHFTFQGRAKRLKLHQFIAKNALKLYSNNLNPPEIQRKVVHAKNYVAVLPPYEVLVNKKVDSYVKARLLLGEIKPGDVLYGVVSSGGIGRYSIKCLCTAEPIVRFLGDMPTKATLHAANNKSVISDETGQVRNLQTNEYICCEVLEVSIDADRLYLGTKGVLTPYKHIKLGVVNADELPEYFRKSIDKSKMKYEERLLKSMEFENPNYNLLYEMNGLDITQSMSFMTAYENMPVTDFAKELRQVQASKWAFRSVAEGIEHFKIGNHIEAFQCLNRALNIDPRNVEGLVARGALYANKGSFLKAVEDFDKALKLNKFHVNARKYMGETLVALGRSYEEENRLKEAAKAYRDCLNIIPNHEQARLSLDTLMLKPEAQYYSSVDPSTSGKIVSQPTSIEINSSSENSGSDSNDSSSDSESSDNAENENKEGSLSPLSKRMALHAASLKTEEQQRMLQQPNSHQYSQIAPAVGFNQPFFMTAPAAYATPQPQVAPNVFKLDEDDTETRVRKLLEEASKHKKQKNKKNKKNKTKKAKKEKQAANILGKLNLEEAYKIISNISNEGKLSENLQIYEQSIADIKKRQEHFIMQPDLATVCNRAETPPPPPSMKAIANTATPIYPAYASTSKAASRFSAQQKQVASNANKFSFQIKRPVKVDVFGMLRAASPSFNKSRSPSPEYRRRSRSRSRSRRRSRSVNRNYRSNKKRSRSKSSQRRSKSRVSSRRKSRSSSRDRSRRRRYSRSPSRRRYSRTRSRSRSSRRYSRSRSNSRNRRSTTSRNPFSGRSSPKHLPKRGGYFPRGAAFGNRSWVRDNNKNDIDGQWKHDKFNENNQGNVNDEGPTIEEIDEIISRAQQERKKEIINRDKNILKKR